MPSQPAAKTNRKIKQCALIKIQQQKHSTTTTDGIDNSDNNKKKAPSQPNIVVRFEYFISLEFCFIPIHYESLPLFPLLTLSLSLSRRRLLLGAFPVHSSEHNTAFRAIKMKLKAIKFP